MRFNRTLTTIMLISAAVTLCAAITVPTALRQPASITQATAKPRKPRQSWRPRQTGRPLSPLPPPLQGAFKNLKVLPRDIGAKALQQIMIDEFEDGLGVSCGFCHAAERPGSLRLDYASDAKPEKEIARAMMRMTLKINQGYFQLHRPKIGDPALVITCTTCHQGQPHPDNGTAGPDN